MSESLFVAIYIAGFCIATVIRTWYGMQFRKSDVAKRVREHPLVFVGMAVWGIALFLPFFYLFTSWLEFADYQIPFSLNVLGTVIFVLSLWLLWQSHKDLSRNFTPSLMIRNEHTLVNHGIYQYVRHPMYLSFWCWAIGQALLIPNWIAGPLGIIAIYVIYTLRVDREEQQLVEQFGEAYVKYQKSTGRLFPDLK